jgi:ABC-type polysaccharide/polyol phosphate export permease
MTISRHAFLVKNLVLKDFKIRYRNMSLGILWSVVNPLVMMGILTLLFTKIFPNNSIQHFPVFVLCALVPYNLFSSGLVAGATSVLDNVGLIKHVPFPREIIPISSVLANTMHFLIQIGLLLVFTLAFGLGMNRYWLLLPLLWGLEVVFVAGLAMAAAALDVYCRDVRYVVESGILVMFWLVPIFYSLSLVPPQYLPLYTLNPITAVAQSSRAILLQAQAPPLRLVTSLALVSIGVFVIGAITFRLLKPRFTDYM